jgi:hypothetical protein
VLLAAASGRVPASALDSRRRFELHERGRLCPLFDPSWNDRRQGSCRPVFSNNDWIPLISADGVTGLVI